MEVKIVKNTQMKRACKTNDNKYTKSCIDIQNADITSKQIRYRKWKKGTLTLLCWETFQYRHESIYDMPYHNTGNTNSLIHRYLWQILHSVLLTIKSSALDYLPMNSA